MPIPPVRALTAFSLYFIIASKLKEILPTSIPLCLKSCFAIWYKWELWSRAFEGIQPTFKQVPPRVGSFSTEIVYGNKKYLHKISFCYSKIYYTILFYSMSIYLFIILVSYIILLYVFVPYLQTHLCSFDSCYISTRARPDHH